MNSRSTFFYCVVFLCIYMWSCNSSKELTTAVNNRERPEILQRHLANNAFKYNELSAKISVKYKVGDDGKTFKAILKAKKGNMAPLKIFI